MTVFKHSLYGWTEVICRTRPALVEEGSGLGWKFVTIGFIRPLRVDEPAGEHVLELADAVRGVVLTREDHQMIMEQCDRERDAYAAQQTHEPRMGALVVRTNPLEGNPCRNSGAVGACQAGKQCDACMRDGMHVRTAEGAFVPVAGWRPIGNEGCRLRGKRHG